MVKNAIKFTLILATETQKYGKFSADCHPERSRRIFYDGKCKMDDGNE